VGKVVNVVHGIQAAFVDIGHTQDAFLHFSDIGDILAEYNAFVDLERARNDVKDKSRRPVPKERQEILVQIIKEPISSKGARVTNLPFSKIATLVSPIDKLKIISFFILENLHTPICKFR